MTREEEIKQAASVICEDKAFPYERGFITGAQWADEHPKSPWISVKERKPETLTNVLFYHKPIKVVVLGYMQAYRGKVEIIADGCIFPVEEFTHWMPIPELPKGGEG